MAAEEDPEMDMESKPTLYAGMETTEDNPDEELHRVIQAVRFKKQEKEKLKMLTYA